MVCAFICVVSTSNSKFPGNVFVMDTSLTSFSSGRVLKVFPSTTRSQCLHRCRRTNSCVNVAMVKHDECWLLKDEVYDVVDDEDKNVTLSSFFNPVQLDGMVKTFVSDNRTSNLTTTNQTKTTKGPATTLPTTAKEPTTVSKLAGESLKTYF